MSAKSIMIGFTNKNNRNNLCSDLEPFRVQKLVDNIITFLIILYRCMLVVNVKCSTRPSSVFNTSSRVRDPVGISARCLALSKLG